MSPAFGSDVDNRAVLQGGLTVYRLRAGTLRLLAERLTRMAERATETSAIKPC